MSQNSNNLFVWENNKRFVNNAMENKSNVDNNLKYRKLRADQGSDAVIRNMFSDFHNELEVYQTSIDNTIHLEAKHLVKSWLTNKTVYGAYGDRHSFLELLDDESDLTVPTTSEVHKEWEHLVSKLEAQEEIKDEIKSYLSVDQEDKKLKSIISNLHKKTFVDSSKLRKIDSSKSIDMKKRIENRQEDVKRNREERLRLEEMKKIEKLAEKEARTEAMKLLKEEKKLKELSIKKEEELLQIEMNKIRAELQKKREQEKMELRRLKETQALLEKQENTINSSRQLSETSKKIDYNINKTASDRFEIIAEIVNNKFINKNFQIIRQCFQSWKSEVSHAKIKMEKAMAWFDWQNSRKVFRAWRQYSFNSKINMEIVMDHQRIKLMQMKQIMAFDFWKRNLLKKCLLNWSIYVIDEKETRWCQKLEEMRKKKMLAYIDALQEKALENQEKLESLENITQKEMKEETKDEVVSPQLIGIETERQSEKKVMDPRNNNSHSKSARFSAPKSRPKEIWQITKRDVYLENETLDNIEFNKKYPNEFRKSLKPPKVLNTFANRDAAQKELIKQQQSKIKEQQLLIDEIQNFQALNHVKNIQCCSVVGSEQNNQSEFRSFQSPFNEDDNQCDFSKFHTTKHRNKFVLHMEARAKERERIKAERLAKHHKMEEEKKKQLEIKLAEQTRLESEEKIKKEKLLREKKENERQKKEVKQKRLKWELEANEKADKFYKILLMKHFGIKAWLKLIKLKEDNIKKADNNYSIMIMRKTFIAWWSDVHHQVMYQNQIIKAFYDRLLIRRCLYHMKLFKYRFELMEKSAEEHFLLNLLKKYFHYWRITNHREQIRLDKLTVQCDHFYQRTIVKKTFILWRQLPMAKRVERERERRKDAMRQKVSAIIPDFKPKNFYVL